VQAEARVKVQGVGVRRSAFGIAAVIVLVLAALGAAPAQADYEQAKEGGEYAYFGVGGEAEQLRNATAIAVNESGVGLPSGEAGSFYVVGSSGRVVRFGPGKEGKTPSFREAWGWGIAEGGPEAAFVRCGPAFEGTANPAENTYEHCRALPEVVNASGGEEVGHFNPLGGVAVDQATGNVYVLNKHTSARERHLIEPFSATGTPIGEGFGEAGRSSPAPQESIAEGPAKLHEIGFLGEDGLAVDEAGSVYVIDRDYMNIENPPGVSRVMCFRPQTPGDYEHYEYCGQSHDISTPRSSSQNFIRIVVVKGDRLLAAAKERIRLYPLEGGASLCNYGQVPGASLGGLAADPATGESFYFSKSDKTVHRLGACDEATHEFGTLGTEVVAHPETKELIGLAFDPGRAWASSRPAGILYGADADLSRPGRGIGDIFVPAEVFPPAVQTEFVSGTGTDATTLRARIDPRGATTSYRFEYLTRARYEANGETFVGATIAPLPLKGLGSGEIGEASATVDGLAPDTAYTFRVIASRCEEGEPKALCESTGEAASFSTYPPASPAPPDGRSYELASPAEKHGGEAFPADATVASCRNCKPSGAENFEVFPMQSSPDGEGVVYEGYPFFGEKGAAVFNSYLSLRGGSGWQTTPMSPERLASKSSGAVSYNPSLGESVVYQAFPPTLTPQAPAGYPNLYLQEASAPKELIPLVTEPRFRTEANFKLEYSGHSADFSAQYFIANDSLTKATPFAPAPPDPTSVGRDLYEWSDGALSLVNVAPGNGAVLNGATFASASPDTHAIAAGGRRVFFSVGSTLYVREDGEITREVKHAGSFLSASPDGLTVLLSDGCLYSLLTEACTGLTEGAGGLAGLVGQSEDLSHLYFVDSKILPAAVGQENEYGEKPAEGADNLYSWQQGSPLRYVATLLSTDSADWAATPASRTAEASPAGRYLAFSTTKPLKKGYDNVGLCERAASKELVDAPCREAYLYDSATGALDCASCNPTGESPLGNSTLRRIKSSPAFLPQPRYLTDSGRLYFDSQDRLSPLDTNGAVEDVYEREPASVGSCARAGGCVLLISPGTGSIDSNLLAINEGAAGAPAGADVFFTSRQRLVGADTDELIDVYDAREGGGFASEREAAAGPCQGEACQGSQGAGPSLAAPGSSNYTSTGNVKPAKSSKCPKGKVKRGGKCVKPNKSHKHRATKKRRARAGTTRDAGR
jgi:hypothetical protein